MVSLAAGQLPNFLALDDVTMGITSDLVQMSNKLSDAVSTRIDTMGKIDALQWFLDRKFGYFCGDRVQCGLSTQCVPSYFVCDGAVDCSNGADEADCGVPFSVGDNYNLQFSPDGSCLTELQDVVLSIISFEQNDAIPGRATVGYMVNANQNNARQNQRQMTTGVGQYFFGTKTLKLQGRDSGTSDTIDFRAGGDGRFAIMDYRIGNDQQCNRGVGKKA